MWSHRTATGVTAGCATLWGVSFLVNDIGLDVLHPATFTFWRFLLAAAASVAVAVALRAFDPRILRSPIVWAISGLNVGQILIQYVGQSMTTPARSALFINANVLLVAILSAVVLRQRPSRRTLAAMIVALAGVVLLQTRGDAGVLLTGSPQGDAVVFLAGSLGAGLFILFPLALGRHGLWNLMAWMFVLSALFVAPVAFLFDPGAALAPDPAGWWAILFSAVLVSSAAYTAWAYALRRLTPTVSAVILLLEVLVAAALSLGFGRDVLTPATAAGAALLLAGITALSLTPPREAAAT